MHPMGFIKKVYSIISMLSLFSIISMARPSPFEVGPAAGLQDGSEHGHSAPIQTFANGTQYVVLYTGRTYILPNHTAISSEGEQLSKRDPAIAAPNSIRCNGFHSYKRVDTKGVYAHIDAVCNAVKNRYIGPGIFLYDIRSLNGVKVMWYYYGQTKKFILTFDSCVNHSRWLEKKCSDWATPADWVRGFHGGMKVGTDGETVVIMEPEDW
ncbi:hypothetical protein BJ508DRAFT_362630 [Ascobolus immersus RN42]|uniref:AA1-like domain-containing protein n=1 Tax=Ascobolus immersus RN42 TaxID=1160509 RepID=A0A3N4I4R2_ASCIM|nr:hypothetical protein BJ508DRAFT_362630 [Ascobolus immersus RN42]